MMLYALTGLIFVVTLALSVSAIYFFVEAPDTKKKMRLRLAAIEQAGLQNSSDPGAELLREEVLSSVPSLNRIMIRWPLLNKLHLFIQQAGVNLTVSTLLLLSFAAGFVVFLIGLLFFLPVLLILVLAATAATIPFVVIGFKRNRRFAKFEEMFPDTMDMLARAVRAGHAFTTGLEMISSEMPEPIAGEFRITYEQQNFGLPIREALQNLALRMPLSDVRFFAAALQIQRESGGNLAEILDNIAQVVRERFKILRQVKVHTAQGRMTLYLLMGLTPVFSFLMFLKNPSYIGRLFTDPLGQKALGFGIALQVIGFFVIRKIIRIRV